MNYLIPFPTGNKPIEVAGIYAILAQSFGEELGTNIDLQYKASGSFDWFADLKLFRNSQKSHSFLYDD